MISVSSMSKVNEERIAEEIMKTIRQLGLPLKLDSITEGKGNCFPLSVIAQCKRPDIYNELEKHILDLIVQNKPTLLRRAVRDYMDNSKNSNIINYKKRFEEVVAIVDKRSWAQYWDTMTKNYE